MISKPPSNNNKDLLRYAGLGTQMLVALGLAVFIGSRLDKWFSLPIHIGMWLLPLIVLSGIFYRVFRETSKHKEDGE